MGALFAILQNDPNLLRCQVRRMDDVVDLADGDRPPQALGFGHYHGNDVLVGKRPSGGPPGLTLSQLTGAVESEALLVHGRQPSVGGRKDENTHPFRFRRWLFAQDGTVEAFDLLRPRLRAALPEFLWRNVEGETDAEHVFMLFLKHLRAQGGLDDLDVEGRAVAHALACTVRDLDAWSREAGATRASALGLAVTNGRVIAALRRGRPLHCALLEGILPCPLHGLDQTTPESDARLRAHRTVRAVCLATFPRPPAAGFREVPEATAVAVERDLQVTFTPLASA